jgi:ATP-binding protein involved in chromosome partitioning|tara:strand:- start:1082 stop:2215 length:1134 start_codon:yes stop_codon:yes gene_type:complete
MDKNKVKEILGNINYPGFNRDIVSFGMVSGVEIKADEVRINLSITSQNDEKKKILVSNIEKKLGEYFSSVYVEVEEKDSNGPSPGTQASSAEPVLPNVKHVIAIASGKGGVGKSTVASNIACGLFEKGYKVGLLDLDIYGPSLPITLGINEQPEMTNNKKLVPINKFGLKVMSFGFISGNDTPVIWRGPLVSRMTEQFFKDVEWGELDYLILDLPPGTGDIQLTLTQKLRMSGAIIVTTPQDIALSDVRKGADMFRKVKTPILGVVENMSGLIINGIVKDANGDTVNGGTIVTDVGSDYQIENNGKFELSLDLFKKGGGLAESKRLDIPLLGQIPISNDIVSATDNGEPLIRFNPDHKASKIYMSIVEKMTSILEDA